MNVWLLYVILFVIGLLFMLFGLGSRGRIIRTVGITAMVVILIIAAVIIFVNGQIPDVNEVFSFIK